MSSAGAGAEGYRASELVEFYVSLVVRALAPQPQDTGLLAQHAFHHQCGLIQDAALRVEEHQKRGGGRGCVGDSGIQQSTAWRDPKRMILPGGFLLSYTRKEGSDEPLRCTSGPASNPGQGKQEL